jgi:hypothetical protein
MSSLESFNSFFRAPDAGTPQKVALQHLYAHRDRLLKESTGIDIAPAYWGAPWGPPGDGGTADWLGGGNYGGLMNWPRDRTQVTEPGPAGLLSEQELRSAVIWSRWLCDRNPLAIGFLGHVTNFVLSDGFQWKVVLRGASTGAVATGEADRDGDGKADVDPAVAACQTVLDEFRRRSGWGEAAAGDIDLDGDDPTPPADREHEAFTRLVRDGEVFVRFWVGKDGIAEVRFVEPEQVRAPAGGNDPDCDYEWGIKTAGHDSEKRLAYYVVRAGSSDGLDLEEVPAGRIAHCKANVDATIKRGIPDFFAVFQDLEKVRKLLRNMGEVAAIQAAIAYVTEHPPETTGLAVQQMIASEQDWTQYRGPFPGVLGTGGVTTGQVRYADPGKQLDLANGTKFSAGPTSTAAANFIQVEQAILRAVGTRWGMPEFMSGDASSNNYASTLVAGGPFERAAKRRQKLWSQFEQNVAARVLACAVKAGRLSAADVRRCEVTITCPSVAITDTDKEANTLISLTREKLLSPQTAMMKLGEDVNKEVANIKAWGEEFPDPNAQQPPIGGDEGPDAMGGMGPDDNPPDGGPDDGGWVPDAVGDAVMSSLGIPGDEGTGEFAESVSVDRYELLEEANRSGLVKKIITNKAGKKQAVWVRGNQSPQAAPRGNTKPIAPSKPPGRLASLMDRVKGFAQSVGSRAAAATARGVSAAVSDPAGAFERTMTAPFKPVAAAVEWLDSLDGKADALKGKIKPPLVKALNSVSARLGQVFAKSPAAQKQLAKAPQWAGKLADKHAARAAAHWGVPEAKAKEVLTKMFAHAAKEAARTGNAQRVGKVTFRHQPGKSRLTESTLIELGVEYYTLDNVVLLSEADRSHLVKKVITNKAGNKQTVYVNPNKGKQDAERKERSDRFKADNEGRNPKEQLQHNKAQAEPKRAAAREALAKAQAGEISHEQVPQLREHLLTLTRDELREHARKMSEKVGGLKADVADRVLARVQAALPETKLDAGAVQDVGKGAGAEPPGGNVGLLSQPHDKPDATVSYKSGGASSSKNEAEIRNKVKSMIGDIDPGMLSALANSTDGGHAVVTHYNEYTESGQPEVEIASKSGGVKAYRSMFRDPDGKLVLRNDSIDVSKDSPVRGADLFGNQVRAAKAAGVDRIETMAAGPDMEPKYVGHSVWPKMGYDGPIPDEHLEKMPADLRAKMGNSTSIQDLYATPGGQDWWHKNGGSIPLTFDLKDGSRSMRKLEDYLSTRKGASRGGQQDSAGGSAAIRGTAAGGVQQDGKQGADAGVSAAVPAAQGGLPGNGSGRVDSPEQSKFTGTAANGVEYRDGVPVKKGEDPDLDISPEAMDAGKTASPGSRASEPVDSVRMRADAALPEQAGKPSDPAVQELIDSGAHNATGGKLTEKVTAKQIKQHLDKSGKPGSPERLSAERRVGEQMASMWREAVESPGKYTPEQVAAFEAHIAEVLPHMQKVGTVGETVPFDPAIHGSKQGISAGTPVVVKRSGWTIPEEGHAQGGHKALRAEVEAAGDPKNPEKTGFTGTAANGVEYIDGVPQKKQDQPVPPNQPPGGDTPPSDPQPEPVRRREGEPAVDFLRRVASQPAFADFVEINDATGSLSRTDIATLEQELGAQKSDRPYSPHSDIDSHIKGLARKANLPFEHSKRLQGVRKLLADYRDSDDLESFRQAKKQLVGYPDTESQAMLDEEFRAAYPGDDQPFTQAMIDAERAVERRHRDKAAQLFARKVHADPKKYKWKKAGLPETLPDDAAIHQVDAPQDMKTGQFEGYQPGGTVRVNGATKYVIAAGEVGTVRHPLGGVSYKQSVMVSDDANAVPEKAKREREKRDAAEEHEYWKKRAAPYDDYNTGGYQTEQQRAKAEEWLKRYAVNPVAAYRKQYGAGKPNPE